MVQRLTYRRRHCYATKSNKTRKVKTPGARLHCPHRGGSTACLLYAGSTVSCIATECPATSLPLRCDV